MSVYFHEEDLPEGVLGPGPVAVDTETMGLQLDRDRLCLVQISDGGGDEHLVRFAAGSNYDAPNLKAVLADPARLKLYHFARFDIASIRAYLGVLATPVYCTKTASRLVRTYTDRHGLKELVKDWKTQAQAKKTAEDKLARVKKRLDEAQIKEDDLEKGVDQLAQLPLHFFRRQMNPLTMPGQHPLELVIEQSGERPPLLIPGVPAVIAKGNQPPLIAVPSQMITGEEITMVIQQHHVSCGVTGSGNREKIGAQTHRIITVENQLSSRL